LREEAGEHLEAIDIELFCDGVDPLFRGWVGVGPAHGFQVALGEGGEGHLA